MATQTPRAGIPCRRPKVTVLNIGRTRSEKWDTFSAVCHVPWCDWSYENSAKTDVEQTAVGHRAWHRNAVPSAGVKAAQTYGFLADCECGWSSADGCVTRADCESSLANHLSADHGLVTCS